MIALTNWPFPPTAQKHPCDCCEHKTIEKLGESEICPVCWWAEDAVQRENIYYHGREAVNGLLSLHQARKNYKELGAAFANRVTFVRPPTDAEKFTP